MFKWLVKLCFQLIVNLSYLAYKAEGLNALFMILPAKLIEPTLRKNGATIGDNLEVHSPLIFHNVSAIKHLHYSNLNIGSNCYFGRDVFIDLADKVIIEDNVTVSMRVTMITHTNAGKSPLSQTKIIPSHAPITLKKGCYIASGVTILEGVCIGENAIVGAGAVVIDDLPANITAVGVPARVIRRT